MAEFLTPSQQDADNWPGAVGVVLPSPEVYPVLLESATADQTVDKSADFAAVGAHSWRVRSRNVGPTVPTMSGAWWPQTPRHRPTGSPGDFCAKEGGRYAFRHRLLWSGTTTVQVQLTMGTRWDSVTPGYVALSRGFDQDIGPGHGWFHVDLSVGPCSAGTTAVVVSWIVRTRPTAGLAYSGALYLDGGSLQGPNSCPGDPGDCPPRQPAAASRTTLRLRAHA